MAKPKLTKAQQFFYDNAGFGYDPKKETQEQGKVRMSKEMAKAEIIATEQGWRYDWEEDPNGWDGDADDAPEEVLVLVLRDENGRPQASLGGIGFGKNSQENRMQGRIFEAELALEFADRMGLMK